MLQVKEYPVGDKGTIYLYGPEAHVEIKPEYQRRWFTRKIFNETVGKQIAEWGFSITACRKDSPHISFIESLGYRVVKVLPEHLIFRMTGNKYARL